MFESQFFSKPVMKRNDSLETTLSVYKICAKLQFNELKFVG